MENKTSHDDVFLTVFIFTTRSGWSPLMYAVEAGEVAVAKKMLEMGADAHHHIDSFSGNGFH